MKSNYLIQKKLSFILILFIGFNYLTLLGISTIKILPGFLMQIIFLLDVLRSGKGLEELLSSNEFYLNLIAGSIVLLLIYRLLNQVSRSIRNIVKTNHYLRTLNIMGEEDKYTYIENNINHAFTAGLIHPRIYISEIVLENLDEKEIEVVKLHEMFHLISFDPLKKVICDFVKISLPYIPFKNSLFESYEVLVELSADNFATHNVNSKIPVISALNKMLDLSNYDKHLNISSFSLKNERIPILVDQKIFKTRSYFLVIAFLIFSLVGNIYLVSNTNIFLQCQHIVECINSLFLQASDVTFDHNKICMISDNFSANYHCINYSDQHSI